LEKRKGNSFVIQKGNGLQWKKGCGGVRGGEPWEKTKGKLNNEAYQSVNTKYHKGKTVAWAGKKLL